MKKFPIIDADGHVQQAHVNWRERVPQKYRTMAPEPRPEADTHWRLVMEGKPWPKPDGPGIGMGGPYNRPHPQREGMKDPRARRTDMDSERIDVAALFGGGLAGSVPALEDAGFAAALRPRGRVF